MYVENSYLSKQLCFYFMFRPKKSLRSTRITLKSMNLPTQVT